MDSFQVVGSWQKKPLKTEECPIKRISVGNTSSNHWFFRKHVSFQGSLFHFGFWANLSGSSTKRMSGHWTKMPLQNEQLIMGVVLDYTPETATSNQNHKHYTQDKQFVIWIPWKYQHYLIMPSICMVSMFPIMFRFSFFRNEMNNSMIFLGIIFFPSVFVGMLEVLPFTMDFFQMNV